MPEIPVIIFVRLIPYLQSCLLCCFNNIKYFFAFLRQYLCRYVKLPFPFLIRFIVLSQSDYPWSLALHFAMPKYVISIHIAYADIIFWHSTVFINLCTDRSFFYKVIILFSIRILTFEPNY